MFRRHQLLWACRPSTLKLQAHSLGIPPFVWFLTVPTSQAS